MIRMNNLPLGLRWWYHVKRSGSNSWACFPRVPSFLGHGWARAATWRSRKDRSDLMSRLDFFWFKFKTPETVQDKEVRYLIIKNRVRITCILRLPKKESCKSCSRLVKISKCFQHPQKKLHRRTFLLILAEQHNYSKIWCCLLMPFSTTSATFTALVHCCKDDERKTWRTFSAATASHGSLHLVVDVHRAAMEDLAPGYGAKKGNQMGSSSPLSILSSIGR